MADPLTILFTLLPSIPSPGARVPGGQYRPMPLPPLSQLLVEASAGSQAARASLLTAIDSTFASPAFLISALADGQVRNSYTERWCVILVCRRTVMPLSQEAPRSQEQISIDSQV